MEELSTLGVVDEESLKIFHQINYFITVVLLYMSRREEEEAGCNCGWGVRTACISIVPG